jgi:hypothetical protein
MCVNQCVEAGYWNIKGGDHMLRDFEDKFCAV